MNRDIAHWRTCSIIASKDLINSTPLCGCIDGCACFARCCRAIQVNQHITPYIGRAACFSQSTTVSLAKDITSRQTNGRSMECGFLVCVSPALCCCIPVACLGISQGTTAIDVAEDDTTSHGDFHVFLYSTRLTTAKDRTIDDTTGNSNFHASCIGLIIEIRSRVALATSKQMADFRISINLLLGTRHTNCAAGHCHRTLTLYGSIFICAIDI